MFNYFRSMKTEGRLTSMYRENELLTELTPGRGVMNHM